jgi:nonsense-mediated mRNA decay protein 3
MIKMCDNCRRIEAKDYWRACVQVRQKCDFKKTLFYLEQLILKYNAQANSNNVVPVPTGIDFYYARQQDAKKFVEFVVSVLPCKYHNSQVTN